MKKYRRGIAFGAFDPLHYGHIKLFERAKDQCRYLTVCVSNGEYIKKHKGREEYVKLEERIRAIASINYVDKVIEQGDEPGKTKADRVKETMSDVIFVGNDWTPETFGGEGLGAEVVYLPYTKEINSTQIREQNI